MDQALNTTEPAKTNPENKQIPASIVKAICTIKATLAAVAKSQKNMHGGYNYASIDDIYAAVTVKSGESGLAIIGLEGDTEIIRREVSDDRGNAKTTFWLKATYYFMLATEECTWTHPQAKRTVMVQITGPQTFQAAQSYCEKSWLKSLFEIPTGDLELDALPADASHGAAFSRKPPPPPPARTEPKPQSSLSFMTATELLARIEDQLSFANSTEILFENWEALAEQREELLTTHALKRAAQAILDKHEARLR